MPSDLIGSISFTDSQHGFGTYFDGAQGNDYQAPDAGSGVAETSDGARTWTRISAQGAFGRNNILENVTFTSPTVGLLTATYSANGYPVPADLYITRDGGRSWTPVPALHGATAIAAVGSSAWVLTQSPASSALRLWTTTGSATTWTETPTPLNGDPATLTRVNVDVAYDVNGASIEETTDGGATWHPVGPQPSHDCFDNNDVDEHLSAPSTSSLWIACGGEPGTGQEPKVVFQSDNSGRTWTTEAQTYFNGERPAIGQISDGGYLFDGALVAISPTTAYMALGRLGLEESTDSGKTWHTAIPTISDAITLDVINHTDAVAALNGGDFWSTTNSTTWTPTKNPEPAH